MTHLRTLIIGFLFAGIVFSSSAAFASDFGKNAESFVQKLADDAISAFRTIEDQEQRDLEFRRLLNEGFDVRAIGKWVLGRHWRRAADEQKEEYLNLFEDFVIVTYANRFEGYSGEDIQVKVTESITKNDNDAIVRSQIIRPDAGEPLIVDWRVKATSDDSVKVVDVIVAGVSMSQTQRSEFASVIRRNGGNVEGLIMALKTKTAELVNNVDSASN